MILSTSSIDLRDSHVMAIVNVTPDSFYSGSRTLERAAIVERVEAAICGGATIIDIGGYSSRPNAEEVSLEQEWERVRMGLEAVRSVVAGAVVSIDSFRSEVIRRAVEEFGDVIDDFAPYLYCVCDKFEVLKEYQRKFSGKRFLWYVCCGDGRPNTQLRLHLTEARMIGAMNYHFGFDGFLRWAYTIWPENPRLDARYSFYECGDTALVYPAYNGDVLLSLRYKGLLRGISDYELLKLLDEKGNKEYAASLVASLFEEQDLVAYKEKSKETRRGAHSHNWEDFNDMKTLILSQLCT